MRPVLLVIVACGCGRARFDPIESSDAPSPAIDTLAAIDTIDPPADMTPMIDGNNPQTFTYQASLTECIDPGDPDPTFCRTNNGATELPVDLDDTNLHVPFYSYVRFDFDQQITGRTITAVTLRLVISDEAQADGPSSGEIWRVSTFTLASLQTTTPTQLGAAALGAAQGPLVQLQAVDWVLPTTLIDGGPLCIGVIPLASAGVSYWGLLGATPPSVRIDVQ